MPPPPDPFHVLRTHSAPLSSLAFGSNNTLLYSGDQDGYISITDLRTRRSILFWKAHEGGILGVGEWDGRLISHGRDNLIHIYDRLPLIRRSGHLNFKSDSSGSTPGIWKSLVVNTLNFCRFTLLPIPTKVAGAEAEALISVSNLIDTELADIYHIPSMKRLHAGVNTVVGSKGKGKAGPMDPTRAGLIMSLHLRFLTRTPPPWADSATSVKGVEEGSRGVGRLVLILGYEDGRVDMWGMTDDEAEADEEGKEAWRGFSDGSGQVGKPGWEVLWSGKGHNEAIMAMTVSSGGRYAYTVSADHLLIKYDMIQTPRDQTSPVPVIPITKYSTKQIGNASVSLSSDDAVIAVGGWDGKVRLFSAGSGKALGVLGYHRETVQCLAFPSKVSGMDVSGMREVVEASTLELGDDDDEDDSDEEFGGRGGGGGVDRRLVSGGKDRRVALWELMDFKGGV